MSFEKWETVELNQIAKTFDCPHSTPNWTDSGVFVIRSWNVRGGRLNFDKSSYTDEKTYLERTRRAKLEFGDLVLTREAPMGEICMVPENLKSCLGQRVVLIKPNREKVDPHFLLYAFQSDFVQNQIMASEGTGSTVSNLRIPLIETLKFPLPDPPTQRRIAAILTALDDKIELNRRMNETLEGIAQAVWGEWFGKYASGEKELPSEKVKTTFEEHLNVERGLSYKGEGLVGPDNGGIPMYNLNSVLEGGGFKYAGMKYYLGEYKERHLANPGELIVANTEQGHKYLLIGFPAVVPKMFGQGICSHHIYRVRTKPESYLTTQFFYYLMLQPVIREQIVGCANGTTVNMLKIDGLKVPEFYLPPEKLIQDFSILAQNIWDKQEENREESRTLTALRDALLPRLMRGEIQV